MDGVISDTQKLHSKVESELLARYNIQVSPEEITDRYAGVRTKDFFDDLLKYQAVKYDLDHLMNEKWSRMEKFASETVSEIAGSISLIEKLFFGKYVLAVASASNLNYVHTVLRTLGVFKFFSSIVSGDMVKRGKPEPESFLLASKNIKVLPENCVVIEDGVSGMVAADRAGMKCIGLVKNDDKTYPTKNLITSLSKIDEEYLKQLQ